jgi:type I restriction enzyme M protein
MPIKKSELYSSLWSSCDELRGGMDASQYKDYVLVLLFIKYVMGRQIGEYVMNNYMQPVTVATR